MNDLFNTPFESGLRALLILSVVAPENVSVDRMAAYDFMAMYGKDFGLTTFNLHGNSVFNFSEFPAKRSLLTKGVKDIALDGLITILQTASGFMYQINKNGITFVKALDTDYSQQYFEALKKVHATYSTESDANLTKIISAKALSTLRR